jgi:dihydropteroate synthase
LSEIKARVLPTLISVDTWKAEVAEACLQAGADWINDIWGLRADARLAEVIARYKATVVLMHNRSQSAAVRDLGTLGSSYQGADYNDLIPDIISDLNMSIRIAREAGIEKERIILDPGIGFGKTVLQNLSLINHLDDFKALGYPLLIGPSRKSFIGQVLDLPVEEREEGTAAAVAIGIAHGADIIRVHNVRMMARVAKMADAIVRD